MANKVLTITFVGDAKQFAKTEKEVESILKSAGTTAKIVSETFSDNFSKINRVLQLTTSHADAVQKAFDHLKSSTLGIQFDVRTKTDFNKSLPDEERRAKEHAKNQLSLQKDVEKIRDNERQKGLNSLDSYYKEQTRKFNSFAASQLAKARETAGWNVSIEKQALQQVSKIREELLKEDKTPRSANTAIQNIFGRAKTTAKNEDSAKKLEEGKQEYLKYLKQEEEANKKTADSINKELEKRRKKEEEYARLFTNDEQKKRQEAEKTAKDYESWWLKALDVVERKNKQFIENSRIAQAQSVNKQLTGETSAPKSARDSASVFQESFAKQEEYIRDFISKTNQELRDNVAMQNTIAKFGADSREAIILKATQKEEQIYRNRNRAINAIEKALADGKITTAQATNAISKANENATTALQKNTQALENNLHSIKGAIREHKNLLALVFEFVGAYRIANSVVDTFIQGLKSIPQAGIQMEATNSILTATFNGASNAVKEFTFLNAEAMRTGIPLSALRETYRTFSASALMAGESAKTVKDIFMDMNTTSTSLHMSGDNVTHTFLALAQMFNKGKIQAEELVKQLGNLIPAAFATFAKANNKTTEQLIADMQAGGVRAHETLKNFAKQLGADYKDAFTLASDGLNANIGRLQTSWTLLAEALYNLSKGAMTTTVKGVTDIVLGFTKFVEESSSTIATLKQLSIALGYATAAWFGMKAVMWAVTAQTVTTAAGITTVTGATTLLATAQKGLNAVLAINPFVAAATVLAGYLSYVQSGKDKIKKLADEADRLNKILHPEQQQTTDKTTGLVKESEDIEIAKKSAKETEDRITDLEKSIARWDKIGLGNGRTAIRLKNELNEANALYLQFTFQIQELRNKAKKEAENTPKESESLSDEVFATKGITAQTARIKKDITNQTREITEWKKQELANIDIEIAKYQQVVAEKQLRHVIVPKKEIQKTLDTFEARKQDIEVIAEDKLLKLSEQRLERVRELTGETTTLIDKTIEKLIELESSGGKNNVSNFISTDPKTGDKIGATGALGPLQVLPSTMLKPGYNVKPILEDWVKQANEISQKAQKEDRKLTADELDTLLTTYDKHKAEVLQFGKDYLKARIKKQGLENALAGAYRDTGKEALYQAKIEIVPDFATAESEIQQHQESLATSQANAKQQSIDASTKQLEIDYDLKKEQESLTVELLKSNNATKLQGTLYEINLKYAEKITTAQQSGDKAQVSLLQTLQQVEQSQARITNLTDTANKLDTKYNQDLQNLTNSRLASGNDTYQLHLATYELQNKYISDLTKVIDKAEAEKDLKENLANQEQYLLTIEEQRAKVAQILVDRQAKANQIAKETKISPRDDIGKQLQEVKDRFNENKAVLDGEIARLSILDAPNQLELDRLTTYLEARKNLIANHQKEILDITLAGTANVMAATSEAFLGLTQTMQQIFGEQSTQAKAMFALHKSAAVIETTISTYSAAQKAYESAQSIPVVGSYLAPVAAGAAIASGLARVATIASQPMPTGGVAHGGLDNVQKESTFLLDKGERVISPKQNKDLTDYLKQQATNSSVGGSNSTSNVRIINSIDPALMVEYMGSTDGEQVILNVVRKNKEALV